MWITFRPRSERRDIAESAHSGSVRKDGSRPHMVTGKPHICVTAITRFADRLREMGDPKAAGDFTYPEMLYFPVGDPRTVPHFFFAIMHRFGRDRFRYRSELDANSWSGALEGYCGGRRLDADALVATAIKHALLNDPDVLAPKHLRTLTFSEFQKIFSDDVGPIPFPDTCMHWRLTRAYGEWFDASGTSPEAIVDTCTREPDPIRGLIRTLAYVPGYREDPLQTKMLMLAHVLAARPERFLPSESPRPIVRCAFVRIALRTGMVVLGPDLRGDNILRKEVVPSLAIRVRAAAEYAAQILSERSRLSVTQVSDAMNALGSLCREDSPPPCPTCLFRTVCKKDAMAFQCVVRNVPF